MRSRELAPAILTLHGPHIPDASARERRVLPGFWSGRTGKGRKAFIAIRWVIAALRYTPRHGSLSSRVVEGLAEQE